MRTILGTAAAALLLSAISGCESDAKKFERLQSEKSAKCAQAEIVEGKLHPLYNTREYQDYRRLIDAFSSIDAKDTARERIAVDSSSQILKQLGLDTLVDQYKKAHSECELAMRKYESYGR